MEDASETRQDQNFETRNDSRMLRQAFGEKVENFCGVAKLYFGALDFNLSSAFDLDSVLNFGESFLIRARFEIKR